MTLTDEGEYVFLELNAPGPFLYVETMAIEKLHRLTAGLRALDERALKTVAGGQVAATWASAIPRGSALRSSAGASAA